MVVNLHTGGLRTEEPREYRAANQKTHGSAAPCSTSILCSKTKGSSITIALRPPLVRLPTSLPATMLSRSSLGRQAQRALRRQCVQPAGRRGLAAPASGSFQYETGDASGVKFASRDMAGPTTTLAVVSKAGTRYQPLPGLTEALEKYAFKVRMQSMAWTSAMGLR